MATGFTVALSKLIKEFSFEPVYVPKDSSEILISST